MAIISDSKYSVRYKVRARPGLVSFVYIWLKN